MPAEAPVVHLSDEEPVIEFPAAPLLAEIHLSGTEQRDENGFVIKEILRAGEWPIIPTSQGRVNKPLKVIIDGKSNQDEGIIAMSELVENFHAGAIPNPQLPLSDDEKEHKNITRLNTGFVRDLWIDNDRLWAKMEFTEPDVKEKVLRGTYADVSCGIPWNITSRGQQYGTCLEHCAITNKPFIDDLGPFLAMSDDQKQNAEVAHFGAVAEAPLPAGPAAPVTTPPEEQPGQEDGGEADNKVSDRELEEQNHETDPKEHDADLTFEQQRTLAQSALTEQLKLTPSYTVTDLKRDRALVSNSVAGMTWEVPFTITKADANVPPVLVLKPITEWITTSLGEENDDAPAEVVTPPPAAPRSSPSSTEEDELEAARRLRQLRFSEVTNKSRKEGDMPTLTREELDRLELSDEQRAAFTSILDENADLSAKTREGEADQRITELSELGLKERPGFLKFYRQVFLSDDGGPAAVLLSDDGTEKKETLTALEILDRAVDALKGSDESVNLSDQALLSGNDQRPPADADGEKAPYEDRLAKAKAELGQE